MKNFKEKLALGKPLIGTLLTLGLPSVSEMVSHCGFDWLWIDMEHAPLSLEQVQQLIQAKTETCSALVRVPANDDVWIKRVADLGADGIIVPQVKTAKEAAAAIAAAKYPPVGIRSAGIARAHMFGMDFASYIDEAKEKFTVILQIEHKDAVRNVDEILQVAGVDAIIIGPYDLSGSYGKLGQIQDAEVQKGIETVFNACKKHKIPVGIFALQPEQAKVCLKQGYDLIAMGIDSHFLWSSAKKSLEFIVGA